MVVVTEEMRVALTVLASEGVRFHPTREKTLGCGCVIQAGWVTRKMEPGLSVKTCSPAHSEAFQRARARWADPDVVARFDGVEGHLSMATLLEEETARA